jgi:hypothetical protein
MFQQPDIVPIIPIINDTGGKLASGIIDTCGKLPLVTLSPAPNLPPVSTTLAKLVAKFAVDTGGAP